MIVYPHEPVGNHSTGAPQLPHVGLGFRLQAGLLQGVMGLLPLPCPPHQARCRSGLMEGAGTWRVKSSLPPACPLQCWPQLLGIPGVL